MKREINTDECKRDTAFYEGEPEMVENENTDRRSCGYAAKKDGERGSCKKQAVDAAAKLAFAAAVLLALFAIAFGSMLPVVNSGSTQTYFEVIDAILYGRGSDLGKVVGRLYGGCIACIIVSAVCFIAGACLKLIPLIKGCRKK